MTKIFVGGLSETVTQFDLEEEFSHFGRIRDCFITPREPTSFAYIVFDQQRQAENAIRSLDKAMFLGGRLRVEYARDSGTGRVDADRNMDFGSVRQDWNIGKAGGWKDNKGNFQRRGNKPLLGYDHDADFYTGNLVQQDRARDTKCYNCGKWGHFSKNCNSFNVNSRQEGRRRSRSLEYEWGTRNVQQSWKDGFTKNRNMENKQRIECDNQGGRNANMARFSIRGRGNDDTGYNEGEGGFGHKSSFNNRGGRRFGQNTGFNNRSGQNRNGGGNQTPQDGYFFERGESRFQQGNKFTREGEHTMRQMSKSMENGFTHQEENQFREKNRPYENMGKRNNSSFEDQGNRNDRSFEDQANRNNRSFEDQSNRKGRSYEDQSNRNKRSFEDQGNRNGRSLGSQRNRNNKSFEDEDNRKNRSFEEKVNKKNRSFELKTNTNNSKDQGNRIRPRSKSLDGLSKDHDKSPGWSRVEYKQKKQTQQHADRGHQHVRKEKQTKTKTENKLDRFSNRYGSLALQQEPSLEPSQMPSKSRTRSRSRPRCRSTSDSKSGSKSRSRSRSLSNSHVRSKSRSRSKSKSKSRSESPCKSKRKKKDITSLKKANVVKTSLKWDSTDASCNKENIVNCTRRVVRKRSHEKEPSILWSECNEEEVDYNAQLHFDSFNSEEDFTRRKETKRRRSRSYTHGETK